MPEERNMYKRGKTWWLRVTVKGEEYRESLRCSDVKKARQLRDKKIANLEASKREEPSPEWIEAVTAWGEHAADQIAPSTYRRYLVSLSQCEPYLREMTVGEIDGKVIARLTSERRKVATSATVRRDLTAVSRVLEYAEHMEWREGNPTLTKRKLLKERRNPIVLPDISSIEGVITAASQRFGWMVRAALLTGCRQNELVTATWTAFKPSAMTLEVIGKGNKRRTLQLSPDATRHILDTSKTLDSDLIFCREDGSPFSQAASDFTHFRRKAMKEAEGVNRFRFHDLRHLFAVEALRSGMGIYALSKHLGHTSVRTTEIYLDFLTPEEAEKAKAA